MYVRLAFAVAAHLEPEILLVDEVLAVGDIVFQNKCLGKMDKVAREGRTVFFVSHNLASIKRLCSTALWLSQGQVLDQGEPQTMISEYLQDSVVNGAVVEISEAAHLIKSPLQIQSIEILNSKLQPSGLLYWDEEFFFRLFVVAKEDVRQAKIGIGIHAEGIRVSTFHSAPTDFPASNKPKPIICKIPRSNLLPNFYSIQVGAHVPENGRALDWVVDAISFRIEPLMQDGGTYDQKNSGVLHLNVEWSEDLVSVKELVASNAR